MKKSYLFLLLIGLITLSSCKLNRYSKFNERLQTIPPEETGYIFFTQDSIIEDETKRSLTNLFEDALLEKDIVYDSLGYNYYVVDTFLCAQVNYQFDASTGTSHEAIIILNFFTFEILLVDILLPTTHPGYRYIHIDEWQNILCYNSQDNTLSHYLIEGATVRKETFNRPAKDAVLLSTFYQGKFIRYVNNGGLLTTVDIFDYLNKTEFTNYINLDKVFNYPRSKLIQDGEMTYTVDFNEGFLILNEQEEVVFKEDKLTLFDSSAMGIKINEILKDLKQEATPRLFYFYIFDNNIYLLYKYQQGFLFNKNLFGETPYLIFRFDIAAQTLKYLGLEEDIKVIYRKAKKDILPHLASTIVD